jgi:hypothetical protein
MGNHYASGWSMVMEIVGLWVLLAVACAIFANTRGRNWFGWLLLAVIISPLFGFLFLAVLPNRKNEAAGDAKTCPQCAETVKLEAKVCRFCGHRFEGDAAPVVDSSPHEDRLWRQVRPPATK